jgi:hypothetical protein
MKKMILLIAVVLMAAFGASSQKQISPQTHGWIMYFGNHKLSEHWGIHTEYQWRRADGSQTGTNPFENWQQSLLRLGVDYYTKSAQYTAGYGWIKTFEYGDQPVSHAFNEHRIWEQFIVKNKLGTRVDLQHRYRLEQRFLEQWTKNSSGDYEQNGYVFRNRVRYRLMATIPLSRKEMADNTLFLALYDEVFIGFGKGIAKNIVDQNRLYGAIGWRFNKNFNVQLGYLNQYVVKTDGIKAERNHTLQLGITYNLDLSKKQ